MYIFRKRIKIILCVCVCVCTFCLSVVKRNIKIMSKNASLVSIRNAMKCRASNIISRLI